MMLPGSRILIQMGTKSRESIYGAFHTDLGGARYGSAKGS
jgi:hypothetical protein